MISGITSAQPESARGTIGMSSSIPTVTSPDPARMMLAGRRPPARLPATSAVANIVSDSGASVRPVCMALYSRTICR